MWKFVDTVVVIVIFSFFFSPLVNIVHGVFDDAQTFWLFWGRDNFRRITDEKKMFCLWTYI